MELSEGLSCELGGHIWKLRPVQHLYPVELACDRTRASRRHLHVEALIFRPRKKKRSKLNERLAPRQRKMITAPIEAAATARARIQDLAVDGQ